MTMNNHNSSARSYNPDVYDNPDEYSKGVLFGEISLGTLFKHSGYIWEKVDEYWACVHGMETPFSFSKTVFIKPATIEPGTKPLAKNNPLKETDSNNSESLHPIISFSVCESLPYNVKAGVIGLFSLIKIQLENRFLAGNYTFDEIKSYAFRKIDAITPELGWVFGNWSIFITSLQGNPSKQIPGMIYIGFTDENQEDSPEMCSITVQFPIGL